MPLLLWNPEVFDHIHKTLNRFLYRRWWIRSTSSHPDYRRLIVTLFFLKFPYLPIGLFSSRISVLLLHWFLICPMLPILTSLQYWTRYSFKCNSSCTSLLDLHTLHAQDRSFLPCLRSFHYPTYCRFALHSVVVERFTINLKPRYVPFVIIPFRPWGKLSFIDVVTFGLPVVCSENVYH